MLNLAHSRRHYGDTIISMSDLFDMEAFRNAVSFLPQRHTPAHALADITPLLHCADRRALC